MVRLLTFEQLRDIQGIGQAILEKNKTRLQL